ncbi:uncharacterized protein B0T15DRAFT_522037 [Chaetomium strumarium]|uniref:Uncharacterized protein n=1 Tax=Chaetomium strumarium TaxID=1170767 RepID=A0AAJ0M776_9PEZI|nr:hypothetical protein B0T15DRAFT_522037 [Chaetomium strumarium]
MDLTPVSKKQSLSGSEPQQLASTSEATWRNPVDAFLDGLERPPQSLTPKFETVLTAVQDALKDRPSWMRELCELELGEWDKTSGSPDQDIAKLLKEYLDRRPCVIDNEKLQRLRTVADRIKASTHADRIAEPQVQFPPALGIPSHHEILEAFIERHQRYCHPVAGMDGCVSLDLTEIRNKTQNLAAVDELLGVAGFFPDFGPKAEPTVEEVRRNLREHIQVTHDTRLGDGLDVSLAPFDGRDLRQDDSYVANQAPRVIFLYTRLAWAIKELREGGILGDHLTYLRRRRVTAQRTLSSSSEREAEHGEHGFPETRLVEPATVSIEAVDMLLDEVTRFAQNASSIQPPASPSLFGRMTAAIVTSVAPFFANGLLLAGLAGLAALTSVWNRSPLKARLEAIIGAGQVTNHIIEGLAVPGLPRLTSTGKEVAPLETLHRLGVTGQFLSLVLQSHIRGFDAPFEFDDIIDRPISHFRLQGLDHQSPPVLAFKQHVSCFPDNPVLVIDIDDTTDSSPADLQATPAALMALWSPTKLLIRKPAADVSGCSLLAMAIKDGLIGPDVLSSTMTETSQLWRWTPIRETDSKTLCRLTEGTVNIHREVRCAPYRGDERADGMPIGSVTSSETTLAGSSRSALSPFKDASGTLETGSAVSETEGGPPDGGPPNPVPTHEQTSQLSSTCPWDREDEDKARRTRMKTLERVGYRPPGLKMNSFQVALLTSSLPGVGAQVQVTAQKDEWNSSIDIKTAPGSPLINDMDKKLGLFLSLHAGVAKRVPTRDVVAHHLSLGLNPVAARLPASDKVRLLSMLQSREQTVLRWCETMETKKEGEKLVDSLDALIEGAKPRLAFSGVKPNRKGIIVPWGDAQLKIPRRGNEWIAALGDTGSTVAFAEIVPTCQETPECNCRMAQEQRKQQQQQQQQQQTQGSKASSSSTKWEFSNPLRLQTTIVAFKTPRGGRLRTRENIQLQFGKSYFVNSPKLGVIAKLIGRAPQTGGEGLLYFSARQSSLRWLSRYFSYGMIQECLDSDPDMMDCVLCSGEVFESQVREYLKRAGLPAQGNEA